MTKRRVGGSDLWMAGVLVYTTGLSALFQLALLSAAARVDEGGLLGQVAILLAVTQFFGAMLLSDSKSLSIRRLVGSEASLIPLVMLLGLGALALVAAAALYSVATGATIAMAVALIRVMQAQNDLLNSVWQRLRAIFLLAIWSTTYFGGAAIMVLVLSSGRTSFDVAVWYTVGYMGSVLILQTLVGSRIYPAQYSKVQSIRRSLREAAVEYSTLSVSGAMNALPQPLLRSAVARVEGLVTTGQVSVIYQILMLPVPLITAVSQVLLGRKVPSADLRRREISIGLCALLIPALSFVLLFYTPLLQLGQAAFPNLTTAADYVPWLIASAYFIYCAVFLGYYAVRMGKHRAQVVGATTFLVTVILGCLSGIALSSIMAVVITFAAATAIRASILLIALWKA